MNKLEVILLKNGVGQARGEVREISTNALTICDELIYTVTFAPISGSIFSDSVKRILKSGNRTIVFWADGSKTIVKTVE